MQSGLSRGWRTIVCVASGPSFSQEQADEITAARTADRCSVIAINDNWRRLPTADILYACDGSWWDVHLAAIRASGFAGELWTQDKRAAPDYYPTPASAARPKGRPPIVGLNYIAGKHERGLPKDDTYINNGRNSGFQAVNLAYLFGAKRIILVGYDMRQGPNGEQHWFGQHKNPLHNNLPFAICISHFHDLAVGLEREGVDVVNASTQTAIDCFRRDSLAKALSHETADA